VVEKRILKRIGVEVTKETWKKRVPGYGGRGPAARRLAENGRPQGERAPLVQVNPSPKGGGGKHRNNRLKRNLGVY